MKIPNPIPEDLRRVAAAVVWFMAPEESLRQTSYFLAHLMTYGTEDHLQIARAYFDEAEFREILRDAPVGVFTREAWVRWHRRFGQDSPPPRPRRVFPDGTVAPLWEELAWGEKLDL
jgi:hypothetical protein